MECTFFIIFLSHWTWPLWILKHITPDAVLFVCKRNYPKYVFFNIFPMFSFWKIVVIIIGAIQVGELVYCIIFDTKERHLCLYYCFFYYVFIVVHCVYCTLDYLNSSHHHLHRHSVVFIVTVCVLSKWNFQCILCSVSSSPSTSPTLVFWQSLKNE